MAEIQLKASGGKRRKLSSPRVDLTPMVDLGFLLITFFMYTTTLAQPNLIELQMPDQQKIAKGPEIPAESTLILIPVGNRRIAYYNGLQSPAESLYWCRFEGNDGLRELLNREQSRVRALPATFSPAAHRLHVLIKPDTSAEFEDVVHVLDEIAIAEIPYSTMMRISDGEQEAVKMFSPNIYGK